MGNDLPDVGTFWSRKDAMIRHALPTMSKVAAKVVHILEKEADSTTGRVTIGTEDLSRKVGSDRKAVREALKELVTAGVLHQEDEGGGYGQKKKLQLLQAPPPAMRRGEQNYRGAQAPEDGRTTQETTGALAPSTGGAAPHLLGSSTPTYIFPSTSSNLITSPRALSTKSSGMFDDAAFQSRVKILVDRGVYRNQAPKLARAFTMGELLDHWRWVINNPRIREIKKKKAFYCRLKEHLPSTEN